MVPSGSDKIVPRALALWRGIRNPKAEWPPTSLFVRTSLFVLENNKIPNRVRLYVPLSERHIKRCRKRRERKREGSHHVRMYVYVPGGLGGWPYIVQNRRHLKVPPRQRQRIPMYVVRQVATSRFPHPPTMLLEGSVSESRRPRIPSLHTACLCGCDPGA